MGQKVPRTIQKNTNTLCGKTAELSNANYSDPYSNHWVFKGLKVKVKFTL